MLSIDLNCDLGEGCDNDEELMKYISSANIACGYHAGDETTMRRTVELALEHGVAIGAHPGYDDRDNFGRTVMKLSSEAVRRIVSDQILDLRAICSEKGARLHHVKPHGALYNQAAKDRALSGAIAEAVAKIDSDLVLYGLSGSFLISEAERAGLRTASEVFADRTYQPNGQLTPRDEPNALIVNVDDAVAQALEMVTSASVVAASGERIPIRADTICIHGDGEHAVNFALSIRKALLESGVEIRPV